MDASLLLKPELLVPDVLARRTVAFFEDYLWNSETRPDHRMLLFWDAELPSWFLAGLSLVRGTVLQTIKIGEGDHTVSHIRAARGAGRYISVHDYVTRHFVAADDPILPLLRDADDLDYTSFEFPRFDLDARQVEDQLIRYVSGDLRQQQRIADRFFDLLAARIPYVITLRSGRRGEFHLDIASQQPWMELTGRLCAGNVRFAPGAELFSTGHGASGDLLCSSGLNILPLRSRHVDRDFCAALVDIGKQIAADPLLLHIENGRVESVSSKGGLAARLNALLSSDPAFSTIVEIGLGVSPAARPLVTEWAAASNEAVPGIHVGVGADPSNTARFQTTTHFDFVCEDVSLEVNGVPFLRDGAFLL